MTDGSTNVRWSFLSEIENYEEVVKSIEKKIQRYEPTAYCHNDLHMRNIVKTDKGIKILDFDESGLGYRGYDLACLLYNEIVGNVDILIVNKNNASIDTLLRAYANVTLENLDDLYKEVCVFLEYVQLERMIYTKNMSDDVAQWKLRRWSRFSKYVRKNCQ